MKIALAYFLITSFFFTPSAQEGMHAVKGYSKVIDAFRYLITAHMKGDEYPDNYISQLSLETSPRQLNSKDYYRFTQYIEGAESNEESGLEMKMVNEAVIENEINNDFRKAKASRSQNFLGRKT